MMDWLSTQGSVLVLVMFFLTFLAFGYWAFRPANKQKMEEYRQIPLKENDDGK